jgi:hypothetical protein
MAVLTIRQMVHRTRSMTMTHRIMSLSIIK